MCMYEQVLELADWVVPACTTAPLVGELNPSNTPFSPHPLYGKSAPKRWLEREREAS